MIALRAAISAFLLPLLLPLGALAAQDHSQFIKGPFTTGPDVTKVCLQCHQEQAKAFMKTVHWTWSSRQREPARGEVKLGKINAVNNFCIALPSNEPRCTSCHAGYGWRDASFDFISANMVFEHLVRPESTVRELARVVRPGGRILVHTVNGRHYVAWLARLTPFRFHQWIVERVERRAGKDVYPTQYRANTVARLRGLFEERGCRLVEGGLVDGIPLYLPYPGLFTLTIYGGLLERRLAQLPALRQVLRPNLLMEFERTR